MRPSSARKGLSFRPTVENLENRDTPTVTFHGGNVLTAVEVQPLFYGSGWSSASLSSTITSVNSSETSLVGGAYMDALTRAGYTDRNGVAVGRGTATTGVIDPSTTLPTGGTLLTDAAIQAEVKAQIAAGALQPNDANRLYVVYVQPNTGVNLGGGYTTTSGVLGYHGAFVGAGGQTVRYAVIAYPGGTAGNSSLGTSALDQLTDVTSHEVAEAATDPDVSFASSVTSSYLGWYDNARGEIGDITENLSNASVRLNGFLVQQVSDKNDNLLTIAPPPLSPPPPPPTTTGTTTTITSSPVSYHGWYATATLTIQVKPASGTAIPTGTVQLIYNGQVLGTATLHTVNGVATATFRLVFYANGNYTFTAQYVGSSVFPPSTSSPFTLTV